MIPKHIAFAWRQFPLFPRDLYPTEGCNTTSLADLTFNLPLQKTTVTHPTSTSTPSHTWQTLLPSLNHPKAYGDPAAAAAWIALRAAPSPLPTRIQRSWYGSSWSRKKITRCDTSAAWQQKKHHHHPASLKKENDCQILQNWETYMERYEELICPHQTTVAVIFDHRKELLRKYWRAKYQPDTEEWKREAWASEALLTFRQILSLWMFSIYSFTEIPVLHINALLLLAMCLNKPSYNIW